MTDTVPGPPPDPPPDVPDPAPHPDPPPGPPARPDPPPGRSAGPSRGGSRMRLRLRTPADLLAAVPHLIGFVPTDSLVLAAVRDVGGRPELGAVVRVDLPDPADAADAVGACARRMGRQEPVDVVAMVVGGLDPTAPEHPGDDPPRADVIAVVDEFFALMRVPVGARLWTPRIAEGAPWRCYPPCSCRGVLPDPGTSAAAVATTVLGQVTFGSREAVEQLVRPDPAARSPRRRDLVRRALDAAALDRELAGPLAAARRDHAAVRDAAREIARGGTLVDVEIARVAAALRDPRVRDACLRWSVPDREADRADEADRAIGPAEAEALWTALTRAVPAPEVAEPATLLACAVLVRGGGALVSAALARAWSADPEHTLSRLVGGLLDRGIDHAATIGWIRGASEEAESALLGPGLRSA